MFFDSCTVEEGPCWSYTPGNLIGLSRVSSCCNFVRMCFVREYLWLGNDPRVKLSHELSPTVPPYRHKDGAQARSAGKPTVGQLGLGPPNAPSNDFGGSVLSQSTEQDGDQGFRNRWRRAVD